MGALKPLFPLGFFPIVFALVWFLLTGVVDLSQKEAASLLPHYLFHSFFSIGIGVLFLLLSKHPKWKFQLGFLYLATVFIKLALFALYFQDSMISSENLSNKKVFMILIPLFTGLSLEVFFISRLLKKVSSK